MTEHRFPPPATFVNRTIVRATHDHIRIAFGERVDKLTIPRLAVTMPIADACELAESIFKAADREIADVRQEVKIEAHTPVEVCPTCRVAEDGSVPGLSDGIIVTTKTWAECAQTGPMCPMRHRVAK